MNNTQPGLNEDVIEEFEITNRAAHMDEGVEREQEILKWRTDKYKIPKAKANKGRSIANQMGKRRKKNKLAKASRKRNRK